MKENTNFKTKRENINLGIIIKEQLDLKREIDYYRNSNKQIKNTVKSLQKTKTNFELVFSILIWLSLISISTLIEVHAQFKPSQISNMVFFVETSGSSIDINNHIATCESDFCLNHTNSEGAVIAEQYCNVSEDCGEGCVRRWIDQSNYVENNDGNTPTFNPPEYTKGRDFGQDDSVKPCYIVDCINGNPCIRGGGGVPFATDDTKQDKYFEIQIKDFINLSGEFSIFLLAKPILQTEDWFYFGQSVSYFRHRIEGNYLQLRVPGNPVYRVTPNNSVNLNQWQLIEVHRDILNKISIYINGVDKTNSSNIVLSGTFTIGYLFSAFKTDAKIGEVKSMHGDIASFLVYNKKTSSIENENIRSYFDDTYLNDVLNIERVNVYEKDIELYPNPFSNEVLIKIRKQYLKNYNNIALNIYNSLGEKLDVMSYKTETNTYLKFKVDFKNIKPGFYLVNFGERILKLVKK